MVCWLSIALCLSPTFLFPRLPLRDANTGHIQQRNHHAEAALLCGALIRTYPWLSCLISIMTVNNTSAHYIEQDVAQHIWMLFSPVVLGLGVAGNLTSFAALLRPVLRLRASSLYLRTLCVVDTGALLFGLLPIWLIHLTGYDVTTQHDAICKLRNFLFYSFSDASVWLICAFTVDRFIAVVFPFKKRSWCTRKHARIAVAIVLLLSFVKNVETLVTRVVYMDNNNITKCRTPDPEHAYYDMYVRPWLVFCAVTALPCVLLLVCNACIIRTLSTMHRARLALGGGAKRSSHLVSMTRMCLTVSFTFLLLVSPSIVLLIGRPYWTTSMVANARYNLARAVGNLCQYTNNAVNFMLYFGAGKAFRREIRLLCRTCSCCNHGSVHDQVVINVELTSCGGMHGSSHAHNTMAHACISSERTSLLSFKMNQV